MTISNRAWRWWAMAALSGLVTACGADPEELEPSVEATTAAVGAAGLVAAYSFDEGSGTTASDASGNGNASTLLNGAGWTTGHTGQAANFDGLNDYVSAGNVTALNGLSTVTVSAWVKGAVGPGSPAGILVAKDTAFALAVVGGKALFGIKSGGNWLGFPSSTTSVNDGNFHFVAGVYDGSSVRVYVDGAQQAVQGIGTHTLNVTTAPLEIASCIGGPNCDGSGEMWQGVVDDVRVYNRALSAAEIVADRDTPVSPPDSTPPSVPANLAGTPDSATRISLTWSASTDDFGVSRYRVYRNGTLIASPTAPSLLDSALPPATTFAYSVAAVDVAGNVSSQSPAISVTTLADTTPPSTPGNVTGSAASSAQINLTWAASTDDVLVTGYQVFRNGSLVGSPASTSFSDTGLAPSTTYSYTVVALDAAAHVSAASSAINVTTLTPPDVTPPTAPTGLTGMATSATQINLTWSPASDNVGVTGYRVFRNGTLVTTATGPSYADSGLSPATTYTYTVAAIDAALNLSAPSAAVSVTTPASADTTPPTPPANLAASNVTSNQALVSWSPASDNVGVTGYRVFRNGTQVGAPTGTSFLDVGLSPSTLYSYTVRAVDAALNASQPSSSLLVTTSAAPDTTPPTTPTNLAATVISSSQINLTWTSSSDNVGVTGYRVLRNGSQVGTTTGTTFSDVGLSAATTYSYGIVAVDAALNLSAASAPVSATTEDAGGSEQVALASDDFNRSNGGLGTNWTVIDSDPRIVNQRVQEPTTTDGWDSIAIWTAFDWSEAQYSQVRISGATAHAGCAPIVRAKNDLNVEMYFAYVVGPLGPNARVVLAKFVGHIYGELWSGIVPVEPNDLLFIGVSGTTLTVKLNGSTLATRTDGSITAPGYAGFDVTDFDGQSAPGDGHCDDWEGGVLGAPPPSAPTNLVGTAVSSSQINLNWAAPAGPVAGYSVFRNGVEIGTALSTSFADSGLTIGTAYTYTVAAFDDEGALSPTSSPVTVATLGDTVPPSVPTGLAGSATSASQISLSWTASIDNVVVANYRVYRNGSLIASVAAPSFVDNGLAAATAYGYAVAAVDAAGNVSSLSSSVSVTTASAPPGSPPVVMYSFNENSGLVAADSSGNGHFGSLVNGPGWTSGHSGSGLLFDGANDYLSGGDITALNGLTAVTVSAWIKGSVPASSPDAVLVAEDGAFALIAGDVQHKAQFGIKTGGSWLGFSPSSTSVDNGAFHFVAGVYNGSVIRLYVDGVLESTQSIGGWTLNSSPAPLQVASCLGGPNCHPSGEMWLGTIDDVRVYSRALSSSEVIADMGTPVP